MRVHLRRSPLAVGLCSVFLLIIFLLNHEHLLSAFPVLLVGLHGFLLLLCLVLVILLFHSLLIIGHLLDDHSILRLLCLVVCNLPLVCLHIVHAFLPILLHFDLLKPNFLLLLHHFFLLFLVLNFSEG
jgi:hypothetical protein